LVGAPFFFAQKTFVPAPHYSFKKKPAGVRLAQEEAITCATSVEYQTVFSGRLRA